MNCIVGVFAVVFWSLCHHRVIPTPSDFNVKVSLFSVVSLAIGVGFFRCYPHVYVLCLPNMSLIAQLHPDFLRGCRRSQSSAATRRHHYAHDHSLQRVLHSDASDSRAGRRVQLAVVRCGSAGGRCHGFDLPESRQQVEVGDSGQLLNDTICR